MRDKSSRPSDKVTDPDLTYEFTTADVRRVCRELPDVQRRGKWTTGGEEEEWRGIKVFRDVLLLSMG